VKTGKRSLDAEGFWPHGPTPFGYQKQPVNHNGKERYTLAPQPEEAARLLAAAELVDAGRTIGAAAKANRLGRTHLSAKLRDPIYTGGPRHEAIIPADLFERVNRRIGTNAALQFRYSVRQPFGSLARCARCGSRIDANLNDATYLYYVCNGKACSRPQLRVIAENLEAAVIVGITNVRKWLAESLVSGEWRDLIATDGEAEAVGRELAAKEAELPRLVRLAVKAGPAAEVAEAELESANEEVAALREQYHGLSQNADALKLTFAA
jgi:hypothetical protein